ncbi:glycoside hydrolase family 128 protein [Gonapodya prolifera JEL478]|uniref:Glycoside hydrolase family 128 protein n=1 Tax=Gonapodya prolifera (strain JEL478) TaxID=1344416 RepID=A0A139AFK6_GONPJ|nr:glycoside hydrolase family 128 protein [Gonapodya prolifera JEL478]|eukprot:KXS15540.1 glycoside hydrolase family 128 protein [Gonapodya prolifera JEL478]
MRSMTKRFSAALAIACAILLAHDASAACIKKPATPPPAPPTPPPAAALPAGTTPVGKKGLSFNNPDCAKAVAQGSSWAYNWAQGTVALPNGIQFVPMLWSNGADLTKTWPPTTKSAYYLGFNEPDLCVDGAGASCIPVASAVAAWKQYMEPLAGPGVTLVSPAVTNGGPPIGQAWLDQFIEQCTGCHIGAIALHIYDRADNTAYFQKYMTDAVNKYYHGKGLPVWFTEIGISSGDPVAFINTMAPFMEQLQGLDRYAYFMAGPGLPGSGLNNADCSVTAAGNAYINAK